MQKEFIGKGIDGSVFKITDDKNKVLIFKASNQKKHIEYEEYIHFRIYDLVNCKKYIVKPIELSKPSKKEILNLVKFKYGYAMEYVEGVTLHDAMKMITNSKEYNSIRKQLIDSFTCLWKNGFIHGDSHLKNILVYATSCNSVQIKIIDFGFSTMFSVPSKLNTKQKLLQWFKERWHVILERKRIKKGNPDSMYLDINFIPVFAESHQNVLRKQNMRWSSIKNPSTLIPLV